MLWIVSILDFIAFAPGGVNFCVVSDCFLLLSGEPRLPGAASLSKSLGRLSSMLPRRRSDNAGQGASDDDCEDEAAFASKPPLSKTRSISKVQFPHRLVTNALVLLGRSAPRLPCWRLAKQRSIPVSSVLTRMQLTVYASGEGLRA